MNKNTANSQETIEGEIIPTTEKGSPVVIPQITSLGDVMTTAQLKASTKKAQEHRAIITSYVKDHLKKGTDFGTIGTFKKDVLFKPGQEKIFSLMNLTSRLEKDTDTIEMLGNEAGVIAYICRVYRKGEEIAQGRGAAKVGEKGRDINSTIKIAEKRARMDACLSLGFSEFFTQDLEDPEYRSTIEQDGIYDGAKITSSKNVPANRPPMEAYQRQTDPVTPKQKQQLKNAMSALDMDAEAMGLMVEQVLNKPTVDTFGDFNDILDYLKATS